MKLDHISYVTTHDQLADTVQRLGSRLGITFVDGGLHPSFGTRNFTAPLSNRQYIEVVCPLDHPATESTPWGQAVGKKAFDGGGWLTWVFRTENINPIATKFGRDPIEGHRTRPDGTLLKWKQIGVKEINENPAFPFFIEWLTTEHPSQQGAANGEIKKIVIAHDSALSDSWFQGEILNALEDVAIEWISPSDNDGQSGIVAVQFQTSIGLIEID